MESTVKIFISCHKESRVAENEFTIPVQVGAACNNDRFSGFCYDDAGVNISEKNSSYCEMTAIYWAWKNQISDYYGFFHYRRYLSFSRDISNRPYCRSDNIDHFIKNHDYNRERVDEIIGEYDAVIPILDEGIPGTNYELYCNAHNKKDLDFVLDVIKEDHPDMYDGAINYIHGDGGYYCNMFLMRKDIFYHYCEWIFGILEKYEKSINIESYNVQDRRVHGYLAERLTGIYLNWLKTDKSLKILETPIVIIENTNLNIVKKITEEPDCVVALASDNGYVPYLSTLIESIIFHANPVKHYDVIVFTTDISEENKLKIQSQANTLDNFSVRFFDVTHYMQNYQDLPTHGHFKIETYYRFFIQSIMKDYSKVLYLDSDMVVNRDLADLFAFDVGEYSLAACLDADTAGLYNGFEPEWKNYLDNVLKIKNPFEYFQAGTILFNLDKLRNNDKTRDMLEFALSRRWKLLDQDVLNYFFQGDVVFVDMAWNCMVDMYGIRIPRIIGLAPEFLYNKYMVSRENPFIIHYAGPEKPWNSPNMDFAEYFWQHAIKTPFYETILVRLTKGR